MKSYYRIMAGSKSKYVAECHAGQFIGADYGIDTNLTGKLTDNWREFNKKFNSLYLEKNPDKSKIAAGLACGMLWTVAKGLQKDDIVLCPDGKGAYLVGEVDGDYVYCKGEILPHRRSVKWFSKTVERSNMSVDLKNKAGLIRAVSNVTKHADEIENLLKGNRPPTIISTDETVEDPSVFALEQHLEEFLVHNWNQTELGKKYDIYEEDGELAGRQYPSDTGPIDILAISKDKKELMVVELKKGRASDTVVGQIQRYMGYVMEELAEDGQIVKGVIIALEDDLRIKRALKVAHNIDFYRYKVSFKLFKD
jgi:restriction system protein